MQESAKAIVLAAQAEGNPDLVNLPEPRSWGVRDTSCS